MIKLLCFTLFLGLCISVRAQGLENSQVFKLVKSDAKGSKYYEKDPERGTSLIIYNDGTFEYEIIFVVQGVHYCTGNWIFKDSVYTLTSNDQLSAAKLKRRKKTKFHSTFRLWKVDGRRFRLGDHKLIALDEE